MLSAYPPRLPNEPPTSHRRDMPGDRQRTIHPVHVWPVIRNINGRIPVRVAYAPSESLVPNSEPLIP